MPIAIQCTCGKKLRTGDSNVGKRIRCPGCATLLTVPATASPARDAIEEPAPTPRPGFPLNLSLDDDPPTTEGTPRPPELTGVTSKQEPGYDIGDDKVEDVPVLDLVEEEEFEILEDDRDLPKVKRAKPRRSARDISRQRPQYRSLDEELYDRRDYLFGMDGPTLGVILLVVCLLFSLGICVISALLGRPILICPGVLGIMVIFAIAGSLAQIKR